jgi:hypothetical protein
MRISILPCRILFSFEAQASVCRYGEAAKIFGLREKVSAALIEIKEMHRRSSHP